MCIYIYIYIYIYAYIHARTHTHEGFVYLEGPTPGITGTLLPAVPFTVLRNKANSNILLLTTTNYYY